jgi:hypothetical protein
MLGREEKSGRKNLLKQQRKSKQKCGRCSIKGSSRSWATTRPEHFFFFFRCFVCFIYFVGQWKATNGSVRRPSNN